MKSWKTTAFGWTALVIIIMQTIQAAILGQTVDFNQIAVQVSFALGHITAKDYDVTGFNKP
jgi:hypothetical protein